MAKKVKGRERRSSRSRPIAANGDVQIGGDPVRPAMDRVGQDGVITGREEVEVRPETTVELVEGLRLRQGLPVGPYFITNVQADDLRARRTR